MICPNCGQNIENNKFCPFCGFELSKENIQNLAQTSEVAVEGNAYVKENNFPLSLTGRIERIPYIITKISLIITYAIAQMCRSYYKSNSSDFIFFIYIALMLFFFIASIFAASKRLRDIKWSQWYLLIWILPIVGFGIGVPLLIIKSKYKK
ncbi:DUF805 domain-containing protein [bacterium]|nr:DUF805 domain-containing protein [bacterium]